MCTKKMRNQILTTSTQFFPNLNNIVIEVIEFFIGFVTMKLYF